MSGRWAGMGIGKMKGEGEGGDHGTSLKWIEEREGG